MSSLQPTLKLRTAAIDGLDVITLEGELDIAGAAAVLDELGRMIDGGRTRLVVDLSRLTYVDSSGFTVLLNAQARARRGGGTLVVVAGTGPARRLLETAGLDRAFSLARDLDDARRTLASRYPGETLEGSEPA